jgi:hypothetical protein
LRGRLPSLSHVPKKKKEKRERSEKRAETRRSKDGEKERESNGTKRKEKDSETLFLYLLLLNDNRTALKAMTELLHKRLGLSVFLNEREQMFHDALERVRREIATVGEMRNNVGKNVVEIVA